MILNQPYALIVIPNTQQQEPNNENPGEFQTHASIFRVSLYLDKHIKVKRNPHLRAVVERCRILSNRCGIRETPCAVSTSVARATSRCF